MAERNLFTSLQRLFSTDILVRNVGGDELKIADDAAKNVTQEFNEAEKKHRALSRAGAEAKFKGGLADQSRETTKLHTAHHLLLAAMQKLVDSNIKQKGSNITAERLRMDFNLDRKLTPEEIAKVEEMVNQQINESLSVARVEMPREQAENIGAQMEFGAKHVASTRPTRPPGESSTRRVTESRPPGMSRSQV